MNTKIEKLRAERKKNDGKIVSLQSRNKAIDSQITELENTDIVGIVRDTGISIEMLAELLQNLKENPAPVVPRGTGDGETEEEYEKE
ncbi:MAG: DUF4315 family protein [Oscillospiraceae bacterium]|nr:DUF4315 family protein [Oscillospiraceae bacterium]